MTLSLTVRDVMTPDYPTARADGSVVAAVKRMVEARFGAIPVVADDDVYKGVLGSWDVARLIAQDRDLHSTPVGSVVEGGLALESGTSMQRATAIARGQAFTPVVDGGRLMGIVTSFDFDAHARLQELLGDRMDHFVTDIAEDDEMFYGQRGVYFAGTAAALGCLNDALGAAGRASAERILDIPCGHGRVMRALHAAFPGARMTAADVNRDGVDFCARTFGAEPAYAPFDPRDLAIDDRFDLIWVGSLFTHLDRDRWEALLRSLESMLAPQGLLVFTTLAHQAATALRAFRYTDEEIAGLHADLAREGFAYRDLPQTENWGITLNSAEFVRAQIDVRPGLQLIHHGERAWSPPMPAQDVYACVKLDG